MVVVPPELGEDGDAAAKADENITLDSSKSIALALEAERDFYEKPWKNHPSYKGKAHYCGTPFLARKLNILRSLIHLRILMHHIRATLPDIKARISSQLQKYNAELMQLGGFMAEHNSGDVVLSVITDLYCGVNIKDAGRQRNVSERITLYPVAILATLQSQNLGRPGAPTSEIESDSFLDFHLIGPQSSEGSSSAVGARSHSLSTK
ncbi:Dynamin central region-domain-containing protein [Lentinula edodes]|uniref:Dynamin central region-domain-containing protein n=1 Tax=Lentinula lateritia TaxID=40482 RepID=A0A9W8ZR28_9AGAR|nr:Dynamin central region-domain-containing protein [Lentinula edodes]